MTHTESMDSIIRRDEETRKALMEAFDALGPLDALEHIAYESNRRWKASINIQTVAGNLYWFKIAYELNKTVKRLDRIINKMSSSKKTKVPTKRKGGSKKE